MFTYKYIRFDLPDLMPENFIEMIFNLIDKDAFTPIKELDPDLLTSKTYMKIIDMLPLINLIIYLLMETIQKNHSFT